MLLPVSLVIIIVIIIIIIMIIIIIIKQIIINIKISQNPLRQYFLKKLYNFDNFIPTRMSDNNKITGKTV